MFGNSILPLTPPDEVFYAQTAKEMLQHKTLLVPYLFGQPQFEKPVFLYWLIHIGTQCFGENEFGLRFFPSLFAILGVLGTYLFGNFIFSSQRKAFLASIILMSSFLYIGLARLLLTDMIFSVFIFFSLISFYWGYRNRDSKGAGIVLCSVFSGLAVLTKGPLGFLLVSAVIFIFLFLRRELRWLLCRQSLLGLLCFAAVAFPWYIYIIRQYGTSFIREFFWNDHIRRFLEAEHQNDTWAFYPLSLLLGMFPWGIFTVVSLRHTIQKARADASLYPFLLCWVIVIFVIFQAAHSKLVSYLLPIYPALALITADYIFGLLSDDTEKRFFSVVSISSSVVIALVPIALFVFMSVVPASGLSGSVIYVFIALFALLTVAIIILALAGRRFIVVYLLALASPLVVSLILCNHGFIEPYLTSRQLCTRLAQAQPFNTAVLCSKYLARDVRYYTDKDIAIISIRGKNFFSPHPVPFLDSEKKVQDFLAKQPVTYCVVNRSSARKLKHLAGKGFSVTAIEAIASMQLLKVQQLPAHRE